MSNNASTVIWNCLLLVALVGSGCDKGEQSADSLTNFDWSSPCRFQVEERVRKGPTEATILHTFDLIPTNGNHILRWVYAEHQLINGHPVEESEKAAITAANELYLANPPMLIGSNGVFLGIVDLDIESSLDRMDTTLDKISPARTNSSAPSFKQVFSDPEARVIYDRLLGEYWYTWAGAWVCWAIPPGTLATNEVNLVDESGAILPTTLILENLGIATNYPGQTHLVLEEFVAGKAFAASIEGMLRRADEKWATGTTNEPIKIENASRMTRYEVVTDLNSLKPKWAKRTRGIWARVEGERFEQIEKREYRFIWN